MDENPPKIINNLSTLSFLTVILKRNCVAINNQKKIISNKEKFEQIEKFQHNKTFDLFSRFQDFYLTFVGLFIIS